MIHREGIKISFIVFMVLAIMNVIIFILAVPSCWTMGFLLVSFGFMVFILRFFRNPGRKAASADGRIYAPADGKVMVVEETFEEEYLNEQRIQVSIFMSAWNVHINWFPVGGLLTYYKYHPGKYLVARHPKSSTLNERNTVVIRTENGPEILLRQIAGIVARRIISYAKEGMKVKTGDELGFIRFGSRVDVFLPVDSKILVRPGHKVRGLQTPLADLN